MPRLAYPDEPLPGFGCQQIASLPAFDYPAGGLFSPCSTCSPTFHSCSSPTRAEFLSLMLDSLSFNKAALPGSTLDEYVRTDVAVPGGGRRHGDEWRQRPRRPARRAAPALGPCMTARAARAGASPAATPTRAGLILGGLTAPTALGISAPAVTLPQLAVDLALPTSQTAWVLAAYALVLAVATALSGRLGALRGLRSMLLAGVLLLVVGSILAAAANSLFLLVAGRAVQGGGAGAVTIAALGTIGARYTAGDAAKALGALTAVIAGLSGAGSLIGGAMTEVVGWRAVVALPALSLLSLPAALRLAPSQPTATGRLDVWGALLVTVVTASVVVLLQARSTGLTVPAVLGLLAVAAAASGALARHAGRRPEGFLPRQLVRNGAFLQHAAVGFTLFAPYLAMLFAAPLMLAARYGWSPLRMGLVLLPAAVCAVAVSRGVGGVLPRLGAARTAAALGLLSGAGLLVAAVSDSAFATVFGLAAAISGFAGGQVTLLSAVPGLVAPALRSTAIALFNLVFIVGGSVGSAAAGGLANAFSLTVAMAVLSAIPLLGAALAWRLPVRRHQASST